MQVRKRSSGSNTVPRTGPRVLEYPMPLIEAMRYGLSDHPLKPGEQLLADDRSLALSQQDRTSGFLALALDSGIVGADDGVRLDVRSSWERQVLSSTVIEAEVVRIHDAFAEAGVCWRLTKGAAVSRLDYPIPEIRSFGDADLLVDAGSFALALMILGELGYERARSELAPRYDIRFGKGATMRTREGLEADVHLRFAVGRFGLLATMEDVFGEPDFVDLAGRRVPVPDEPVRLLHACYHAALGGARHLRAFRDVAQLILVAGADWEASVTIAERWRSDAVIAAAIRESWKRLHLTREHPAHRWAVDTRISKRDRQVLRVFEAEERFARQALTGVRVVPVHVIPGFLLALSSPFRRAMMSAGEREFRHGHDSSHT